MNILVVGSGGREHAIVWKIAKSRRVKKIYCAPGNPVIAQLAECVDIKADDISGLRDLAIREKIDLTIVGPEVPLTLGIVDSFEDKGLKVFGPLKKAAEIEESQLSPCRRVRTIKRFLMETGGQIQAEWVHILQRRSLLRN